MPNPDDRNPLRVQGGHRSISDEIERSSWFLNDPDDRGIELSGGRDRPDLRFSWKDRSISAEIERSRGSESSGGTSFEFGLTAALFVLFDGRCGW